jgi:hypothetical protein
MKVKTAKFLSNKENGQSNSPYRHGLWPISPGVSEREFMGAIKTLIGALDAKQVFVQKKIWPPVNPLPGCNNLT